MNDKKDHTALIVVSTLIGIVLTFTVLLFMAAYNNNKNIQRDEYIADHCKTISGSAANVMSNNVEYNCEKSK